MIKLENYGVMGWEHAIRGMRNPMNSWEKIDSFVCKECYGGLCKYGFDGDCPVTDDNDFVIGENDHDLMMKLRNAGTDHRKFMRMITVYVDITAPLYWWKEFDTYKVGTVANSCSTMHKIHDKEFTLDDFSHEHLMTLDTFYYLDDKGEKVPYSPIGDLLQIINSLNYSRKRYIETKDKKYWWQMIQLLPSSYNQKRTVMLNYEVLANIYKSRKIHKLDEWRELCKWIEGLPYSEIITGGKDE